MRNWVISSNPTKTYRARDWFNDGHNEVDWISRNNLQIGDTVYIYEVLPKNGRGGIVYKTAVIDTDKTLDDKFDDEVYRTGGAYPSYITNDTKFDRLRLTAMPAGGLIPFRALKENGFTAPQTGANTLDGNAGLLEFIEGYFS